MLVHQLCWIALIFNAAQLSAGQPPAPHETAQVVDTFILNAEEDSLTETDDATFLRRISLDLIGRPASAGEITAFGLNPAQDKRSQMVNALLASDDYSTNWSRYWRDAIFLRATNTRAGIVRTPFEKWMAESLKDNRPWDAIVTDLMTAVGPVNNDGSTALIFAHQGEPEEIAAEASRLFLGIQIQCANCHDHPWDQWKRNQFHELVAFFPRITVRRDRNSDSMRDYEIVSTDRSRNRSQGVSQFLLTRIDKNRDNFISKAESKNTPLERILSGRAMGYLDKNNDGKLSIQEIKTAQPQDNNRPGQGATEHYMPNLADPGSNGTPIRPAFFANDSNVPENLSDLERRSLAADLFTSKDNPWFAKAMVNRMWSELTSSAFFTPIDDMSPDRSAEHEDALQRLSDDFTKSGFDVKWLIRTITHTKIYQRTINSEAEGFVRMEPSRLRSDQLYDAVCQVLNTTSLPLRNTGRQYPGSRSRGTGRSQFAATFGFDPSIPRADLKGSIPEALFLMNSPTLNQLIKADAPNSLISRISRQVLTDEDVVRELYLTTVGREPKDSEVQICLTSIVAAASRKEGFEDVFWALLNSTEFQTRR